MIEQEKGDVERWGWWVMYISNQGALKTYQLQSKK